MKIATELLLELKRELEFEIKEVRKKIADEIWIEAWGYWSAFSSDLTSQERDDYYEREKFGYLTDLKLAEEELMQVSKELDIISKIK